MARPLGVNPDDEQDSDDVTPALAFAQIGHAGTVESKEALAPPPPPWPPSHDALGRRRGERIGARGIVSVA